MRIGETMDLRPIVDMRCPKCGTMNEGRAGTIGRCESCNQMLAFMSPGRKAKAPKEKPESESRRLFREKARAIVESMERRNAEKARPGDHR